jgi:hypothetical protein
MIETCSFSLLILIEARIRGDQRVDNEIRRIESKELRPDVETKTKWSQSRADDSKKND